MIDFLGRVLDWLIANDVTASEVFLNAALTVVGLLIAATLWKLHRSNGTYKNFNLVFLVMNKEGFPDGAKFVEMGTWLLLSWGFIVQTTGKTLQEWYMQWFLIGFVLRGAYGAYLRSKGDPMETVGSKVVTDTTIKETVVTVPPAGAKPAVTAQAKPHTPGEYL